tara:strand:+ start:3663 stop:3998 length:336 start_codon:yes stop_codon:yes gene_type:complete
MLRSIKSSQRKLRIISLRLEGSTGTLSAEGPDSNQVTVTDNDVGDYTVNLNQAFAAKPIAVASCESADQNANVIPTKSSVRVIIRTIAGSPAAAEADVQMIIIGSDVDSKI